MKKAFLTLVEGRGGKNNNKFYNMEQLDADYFKATWGRVGQASRSKTYSLWEWDNKYSEKLRKGYIDQTENRIADNVVTENSNNKAFDEFYEVFSKYTMKNIQKNYLVDSCSKIQMDKAQSIIDRLSTIKSKKVFNDYLIELYNLIPRAMSRVDAYLVKDKKDFNSFIVNEQNLLDSMDSANIIHTVNPFKDLGIEFEICEDYNLKDLLKTIPNGVNIHKVYTIKNTKNREAFNKFVASSNNKTTRHLIHGTQNPNVLSILKSDLLIRPANAVSFAGSAYGNGCYFASSFKKSINYTGYDPDKLFFISNVHLGNYYLYNGWYYNNDGQINRNQMNYKDLKSMGYDSLFVKPGGGLMREEYISYNTDQNVINYLIWMK